MRRSSSFTFSGIVSLFTLLPPGSSVPGFIVLSWETEAQDVWSSTFWHSLSICWRQASSGWITYHNLVTFPSVPAEIKELCIALQRVEAHGSDVLPKHSHSGPSERILPGMTLWNVQKFWWNLQAVTSEFQASVFLVSRAARPSGQCHMAYSGTCGGRAWVRSKLLIYYFVMAHSRICHCRLFKPNFTHK